MSKSDYITGSGIKRESAKFAPDEDGGLILIGSPPSSEALSRVPVWNKSEKDMPEGKQEGEEAEFDRLKERYIEIRDEKVGDVIIPEFGILRELITGLDELFEVDNG